MTKPNTMAGMLGPLAHIRNGKRIYAFVCNGSKADIEWQAKQVGTLCPESVNNVASPTIAFVALGAGSLTHSRHREDVTMPRYFFHTDSQTDREGTELDSIAEAKCQAIKTAGTIVCEQADSFWDTAEWTMTVTDETGLTQFQLCIVGTDAPIISAGQSARPLPPLHK